MAGTVLLLASIWRPWLGVPLEAQRSAGSLDVHLPGLNLPHILSYGHLELLLALSAAAALYVGRGRPTTTQSIVGLAAMSLPVLFVVMSCLSDYALQTELTARSRELRFITQQFGYDVPSPNPGSLPFLPITGFFRLLIGQLRPGWFLALLGGLLLTVGGWRPSWASARHRPRLAIAGAAVPLAIVLVLLTRGIAGSVLMGQAQEAVQAGDYTTVRDSLDAAAHLNPSLRDSIQYEQALGTLLLEHGSPNSAAALYVESRLLHSQGDLDGELNYLFRAHSVDPTDARVTIALREVSRSLAWDRQDPSILVALAGVPGGDVPATHYILGRILFNAGDYTRALPEFVRISQLTGNHDVDSSALTYESLCNFRLGDVVAARSELVAAVAADKFELNSLARSLATGLYVSGPE